MGSQATPFWPVWSFAMPMAFRSSIVTRLVVILRLGFLGVVLAGVPALAQEPEYRVLAPGTLTVIQANTANEDTLRRDRDLLEVSVAKAAMAWTPKQAAQNSTLLEQSKGKDFSFDTWCLEFAFKIPRLINVQVPSMDATGAPALQMKKCWYLIYRVKNVGWRRTLVQADEEAEVSIETFEKPIRFMPHFVLESIEGLSEDEGLTSYRAYLDRLVPTAMREIRKREDPARRFLDSAAMAEQELAHNEERWGVAIWEDVDSRIDFFSIYIRGLTNAIDWKAVESPQLDNPDSLARQTLKSLRLDFWRPGDNKGEDEEEMSIGYAGLFERTSLGTEMLEAIQRPQLIRSNPVDGLSLLKMDWSDLIEPIDVSAPRFVPLANFLRKVASLPVNEQPSAINNVVGDLGVVYLDELLEFVPDAENSNPLVSLAEIIESISQIAGEQNRRQKMLSVFGPSARRLDWLSREAIMARQVVVLDMIDLDSTAFVSAGPQRAFDIVRQRLDEMEDVAEKQKLIVGLFGPEGVGLYVEATKQHRGIDHAWVFRYEIDK